MGDANQIPVDQTLPGAVGLFAGLWSELAWQSADQRWRIAPGLRVDVFHLVSSIDRFSADPRAARPALLRFAPFARELFAATHPG
jgi:hypothetical protein